MNSYGLPYDPNFVYTNNEFIYYPHIPHYIYFLSIDAPFYFHADNSKEFTDDDLINNLFECIYNLNSITSTYRNLINILHLHIDKQSREITELRNHVPHHLYRDNIILPTSTNIELNSMRRLIKRIMTIDYRSKESDDISHD